MLHDASITYVTFDDSNFAWSDRIGEILASASDKIVEDDDFSDLFTNQLVSDMRTDQAGTTGDQNARTP